MRSMQMGDDHYFIGAEAARFEELRIGALHALRELRERCRHPAEKIVHEENRTFCSGCDTTFWPTSGAYKSDPQLSEEEIRDVEQTRIRLKQEYETAVVAQKRNQAECHHLDRWKTVTEEESRCEICLKDWNEIEEERVQPAQEAPA